MDLDAIKAATWDLHTRAERSGIIADILAGRASRFGVALLLRNLLPVYQALDRSAVGHPALARAAVIEADLRVLAPNEDVPLLPAGVAYAERVAHAGEGLIAHAYVRYLGDLNGGRIMKRRLGACLGEVADAVSFHDYPALVDVPDFARRYRQEIDRAVQAATFAVVESEAVIAFKLNIGLSIAVKDFVGRV